MSIEEFWCQEGLLGLLLQPHIFKICPHIFLSLSTNEMWLENSINIFSNLCIIYVRFRSVTVDLVESETNVD